MKKEGLSKKILRLIYSYDEDFIIEWSETRRKGMLRHILKTTINATVIWGIMSLYFFLNKRSMFGYEGWQTIFVALLQGFIIGVILSLIQLGLGNDRYNRLKEKNL